MRRQLLPLWHPTLVLLIAQLVGVVLFPFLDGSLGRTVLALFGVLVLFFAVRTVQASPALTWISIVLGVPILVLTLLEAFDPADQGTLVWTSILFAIFYFYTSYALIRYMFQGAVTTETLYATGATFTVVAWAFAYTFQATQSIWPGSFSGPAGPGAVLSWFDLLFLSFTNLTSVGLSDIVPALGHAKSVVMLEQVAGLMYVALVISRVVGLTVMRQRGDTVSGR